MARILIVTESSEFILRCLSQSSMWISCLHNEYDITMKHRESMRVSFGPLYSFIVIDIHCLDTLAVFIRKILSCALKEQSDWQFDGPMAEITHAYYLILFYTQRTFLCAQCTQ